MLSLKKEEGRADTSTKEGIIKGGADIRNTMVVVKEDGEELQTRTLTNTITGPCLKTRGLS